MSVRRCTPPHLHSVLVHEERDARPWLKGGKSSKKGVAKLEADDIDEPDTMSEKEFLKIVCRMAWVLVQGKPIEERIQKFCAKHLQL